MKQVILLLLMFIDICCINNNAAAQTADTSIRKTTEIVKAGSNKHNRNFWIDGITGKKYILPDTINKKPISFYLNSPKIIPLAKSLYNNKFRPIDNIFTTQLLMLVTADDEEVRPFYRWCLDFIINISSGGLTGYPGKHALAYATKFPKEFLRYMDEVPYIKRYNKWADIIAYNGLSDYNKKSTEIENGIINAMKKNCNQCSNEINKQIERFAKEITNSKNRQEADFISRFTKFN